MAPQPANHAEAPAGGVGPRRSTWVGRQFNAPAPATGVAAGSRPYPLAPQPRRSPFSSRGQPLRCCPVAPGRQGNGPGQSAGVSAPRSGQRLVQVDSGSFRPTAPNPGPLGAHPGLPRTSAEKQLWRQKGGQRCRVPASALQGSSNVEG